MDVLLLLVRSLCQQKSQLKKLKLIKVSAAEDGITHRDGYIAGPVTDNLAGRLTMDYRKTDGFMRNVYLNDIIRNDFKETGLVLALCGIHNDTLSIDTKIRVSKIDAASIAFNAAFELPFYVDLCAALALWL